MIEFIASRHFLSWLHDARLSLAFTTYRTNRLFLVGLREDGRLSMFERHFDRPMGLSVSGDRLFMTSRWQVWELANALPASAHYKAARRIRAAAPSIFTDACAAELLGGFFAELPDAAAGD